jgi:hypothetical protein
VTAGEFAAGVVDEEMAHGLGGGGKKVGAIFERRVVPADETKPDFMHQGGGLEGVTGRVVRHFIRRQLAQFCIDQRQQFIGGPGVTALDGFQNAGNIAQTSDDYQILPLCARK